MNPASPQQLRVLPGHRGDNQADTAPRLRTAWTAAELVAIEFPPARWAIPGLVAEGVSLLAGPPKVGKSWLTLGFALAVASGTQALGHVDTTEGDVLYLALEDTPRRLQNRLRKILHGRPGPTRLTLATTCPPLTQGGTDAIASWLQRHPDARLVIVDVFARLRGPAAPGMSAYDADYTAITRIKHVADDYGVALVLVHHVRKTGSDDFLTEVSGTNGLAGASDTTLVLKRARGQADATLHITGRDVDEDEHALTFDPTGGQWRLLQGPAHEHTLSTTRAAILAHLREHPDTAPKAIAEATGIAYNNVKQTCTRMATAGQLHVDTTGRYRPPHTPMNASGTVTPITDVTASPLTCTNSSDSGHGSRVTDDTEQKHHPQSRPP